MNTILKSLTVLSTAAALFAAPASAQTMMMHAGAFHALGAPTSGTAALSEAGGKVTLKLSALKTEPGPGLQVWLYQAAAPVKGTSDATIAQGKYVKVGELKKFSGTFTFAAPAGTKLNTYKSVVLWCADVKTAFAAADLK
ncbi:DM13 domain-containing protein (plasmid) [Deinococcus sp. KNUC1210]|uniref:DM13 domain-containing protein n=1 Tax=Deinococcus sp. KNUC1210 TaxID=2917691 RepID=UPI001EEFCA77|nr:DM13 domain-containing protein [Deinococcus sp. KNUC1210]ULH17238.1 DM13 domain-containing protein [Deinococcus sp. KNUC1210]